MITLSNVMKANASSCIGFGIILAFFSEPITHFLSSSHPMPNTILIILGLVLIGNGLHLIWASFCLMPSKFLVLYFSAGDYLWVILTLYLIFTGMWITSSLGIIIALLVAAMVGTFGWLQMVTKKKMGDC